MKLVKVLFAMALVCAATGCGLQRQLNELKNREAQEEANSAARDSALQAQINAVKTELESLTGQLVSMDNAMAETNTYLTEQSVEVQQTVAALQQQQTSFLIQLVALEGQVGVIGVFNPCGAQAANEEVFLKLSSGKYLASFSENGSALTTRFTILSDGNYVTTDSTHCYFTVSNNGTVISNEHN